jgi:hypothetical protein
MRERIRTKQLVAGCSCAATDCVLVRVLARAVREAGVYELPRTRETEREDWEA